MRSTCRNCGEPIVLILAAGGMWIHDDDPSTRTAVCSVTPGPDMVIRVARPTPPWLAFIRSILPTISRLRWRMWARWYGGNDDG